MSSRASVVGMLGKNGAGRQDTFEFLTGEMDYNSGEMTPLRGEKGSTGEGSSGLCGRVHRERRAAQRFELR